MVVTYSIKLFRMGADTHNGILIYLLLLVAETISRKNSLEFLEKDLKKRINYLNLCC